MDLLKFESITVREPEAAVNVTEAAKVRIIKEAEDINHVCLRYIKTFLLQSCRNYSVAEMLLISEKTIKGCLKEIDSYANNNKTSTNVSLVPVDVITRIINNYYGIAETKKRNS